MKTKKIVLITSIIVLLAVAVTGVSFAAWYKFTNKPTGTWEVTTTIPVDVAVGATTGDGKVYQGQNGEPDYGFFKSKATVELTATRDIVLKGAPVVTAAKPGVELPMTGATFVSKFIVDGVEVDTLTLTKDVKQVVEIVVIFPDLSDLQYQGATFSIKVTLSEVK